MREKWRREKSRVWRRERVNRYRILVSRLLNYSLYAMLMMFVDCVFIKLKDKINEDGERFLVDMGYRDRAMMIVMIQSRSN